MAKNVIFVSKLCSTPSTKGLVLLQLFTEELKMTKTAKEASIFPIEACRLV